MRQQGETRNKVLPVAANNCAPLTPRLLQRANRTASEAIRANNGQPQKPQPSQPQPNPPAVKLPELGAARRHRLAAAAKPSEAKSHLWRTELRR